MHWTRLGVGLALVLAGCESTICGPGTVRVDGVCVVARSVDGGTDAASDGAAPPVDAAVDGSGRDAGPPPSCTGTEESICADTRTVLTCATSRMTECAGSSMCVEWSGTGTPAAYCIPEGSRVCDPSTELSHCEGASALYCNVTTEGPPFTTRTDCAAEGPAGTCEVTDGLPRCRLQACDPATFEYRCESPGRGTTCSPPGEVRYENCSASTRCVLTSDENFALACVPTDAVASAHGPTSNFQYLGCTSAGLVRVQRFGYEWDEPCEPAVVRRDGDFVTVATRCLSRDGVTACVPVDEDPRCSDGWTCMEDHAYCLDPGTSTRFPCVAGCVPDTGLCHDPRPCDTATFTGRVWTDARECCFDWNGDGRGVTRVDDYVACP